MVVQVVGQICGFGTKKSGPDGEDGPVSGVVQVGLKFVTKKNWSS